MVDIIVDLQFGSTAKGKLAQKLAVDIGYYCSMRVQSIQAGHTVIYGGVEYKMRTIPCAFVDPDCKLLLGPGCFIHKPLLLEEIQDLERNGIEIRNRLFLDPRATYIIDEDFAWEADNNLEGKVGSTAEGAGASLTRKIGRAHEPTRVQDDDWARSEGLTVIDTVEMMQGKSTLLEGCQGTMLSIHTSPYYPFCTSRECTAAGVMSEAGVAPADVRDVYGVFRTFPIRVGGNSGMTGGRELDWSEIDNYAGTSVPREVTTVTQRQRRIFEFSFDDFHHAYQLNKPTKLVLTFLDYINAIDENKTSWSSLSEKSKLWVERFERMTDKHVDLISTGKDHNSWIPRHARYE